MRAAGERLLGGFPAFISVAGTAETTTLPDASVDFVTAAQAAHWFDRAPARREFARILKPGGWLVLADTYFPGWTATIIPQQGKEQPAAIWPAYGVMRAVKLPNISSATFSVTFDQISMTLL